MADVVVVDAEPEPEVAPEPIEDALSIVVIPPPDLEPEPEPSGETAAAVAETARSVASAVADGIATDRTPEILAALAQVNSRLDIIESRAEQPAPVVVAEDADDVIVDSDTDTPPNRHHRWFQSMDELRGR